MGIQSLGHQTGFPDEAADLTPAQVGSLGWQLHDHFATPFPVLDAHALDHNLATMAAWCAARGVELMPHGKTTMAPSIFHRQLDHGATGITAATPAQVRVMRRFGVPAIQLANQLVQPREAAWIAAELARDPGFSFSCWVDSPAGVRLLDAAARSSGSVIDVLLEIGVPGGRTGCRTLAERAAVVQAVRESPHVRLTGVAGYEGSIAGRRDPESMSRIRAYLRSVNAAGLELAESTEAGAAPLVLSAGGSMFFDAVADELMIGWLPGTARIVLRSGCYIVHDHVMFHRDSPLDGPGAESVLEPALTVWGSVLSRPESNRAFLDVGRRDISFDQGMPVPLNRLPMGCAQPEPMTGSVAKLNDQHAFVEVAAQAGLEVGDRVELGVSHPCTTFDKWRAIPVVRGDVVVDVVRTYF